MKDKTFIVLLILTFWLLAIAQIWITTSTRSISRENEAYNIFQSCALSVTAQDRNEARIERCWLQAEKQTGLTIKRFDK